MASGKNLKKLSARRPPQTLTTTSCGEEVLINIGTRCFTRTPSMLRVCGLVWFRKVGEETHAYLPPFLASQAADFDKVSGMDF